MKVPSLYNISIEFRPGVGQLFDRCQSTTREFHNKAWFLLNFGGNYCILCSLSLCEIFLCCEYVFGVYLFVILLNWRPHLNVKNNY